MDIDEPRRRCVDADDRPVEQCSVCEEPVQRAFDPSPIVPELRAHFDTHIFCGWFCALQYCCAQYDDGRTDLVEMLQQRFVVHIERD